MRVLLDCFFLEASVEWFPKGDTEALRNIPLDVGGSQGADLLSLRIARPNFF